MILPKLYMKLDTKERASFMKSVGNAFNKLDKIRYPYVYENIQRDEYRMSLVERIINEYYSKSLSPTIEQVLNKIEISLGD